MTTAAMVAGLVPLLYATGAGAVSRSVLVSLSWQVWQSDIVYLVRVASDYSYIASEHKPLPVFDENVKPI